MADRITADLSGTGDLPTEVDALALVQETGRALADHLGETIRESVDPATGAPKPPLKERKRRVQGPARRGGRGYRFGGLASAVSKGARATGSPLSARVSITIPREYYPFLFAEAKRGTTYLSAEGKAAEVIDTASKRALEGSTK